jgi:hypothetical protein
MASEDSSTTSVSPVGTVSSPERRGEPDSPVSNDIEKSSRPADKPWYGDPSKVVGVLGFVLSLGTLGERLWVREQEQTQQRLQQLREVTATLADIQGEYLEALAKAPANIYALGVAKNTKRQMHLQTAAALLAYPGVRQQASAQIFGALGAEFMSDGRHGQGRAYFLDALSAPGADDTTKPFFLRALGQLYRVPNTGFTNVDTARDYFKQAQTLQAARLDDAGHLSWAETVLTEASLEVTYGDHARAKMLAEQAKARISKCRSLSPLRAQLERLATAFERGEQFSQTQDAALPQPTPAPNPAPQVPPPAADPTASPATRPSSSQPVPPTVASAIQVWAPISGQISGVEMDIHVDGRQVGRVSNLDDRRELPLPRLAAGFHNFSFVNMSAYLVNPSGGRTLTGSGFACSGFFQLSASQSVLKANVGTGPNGLMCTLQ